MTEEFLYYPYLADAFITRDSGDLKNVREIERM